MASIKGICYCTSVNLLISTFSFGCNKAVCTCKLSALAKLGEFVCTGFHSFSVLTLLTDVCNCL